MSLSTETKTNLEVERGRKSELAIDETVADTGKRTQEDTDTSASVITIVESGGREHTNADDTLSPSLLSIAFPLPFPLSLATLEHDAPGEEKDSSRSEQTQTGKQTDAGRQ